MIERRIEISSYARRYVYSPDTRTGVWKCTLCGKIERTVPWNE